MADEHNVWPPDGIWHEWHKWIFYEKPETLGAPKNETRPKASGSSSRFQGGGVPG